MPRRQVDLRKVFLPSDSIAFVVIALGLFIALFLDEMAVRLIGVCIAVLGGVALFMMVSPRMTDLQLSRPPRPSESPTIDSQVKKDPLKTSRVFDSTAYRHTFGDEEADQPLVDEKQIAIWDDIVSSRDREQARLAARQEVEAQKDAEPEAELIPLDVELGDSVSSVRILGKRSASKSVKVPALAIDTRVSGKEAARIAPIAAGISGPISEEIKLSDEVIVRPKGKQSAPPEKPLDPPTLEIVRPEPEPEIEFDSFIEHNQQQPPVASPEVASPEVASLEVASREVAPPARKKRSEISISAFMADNDDEMESSEEPRKEFDYLLNRVLMVIRSATTARTAAFFWFNREKNQLVLEASITDATEDFTTETKIPVGRDVISQIALDGRPEILTDISPAAELDLLPYYRYHANTSSFVGVPVYYNGNVIGVLCADSKLEDAYSDVTVGFFGHFTKLISGLVASYTTKYDLQQSARILEALQLFRSSTHDEAHTVRSVTTALTDTVIRMMEVSTIGIVAYDHTLSEWTVFDVQSVLGDYHNVMNEVVELDHTEIGQCIKTGHVISSFVSESSLRIARMEPVNVGSQFVCLPLRSSQSTYGAMFLENHEGTLSQQDIQIAETLADHAGSLIEQIRGFERMRDSALLDYESGVLNARGIELRLVEEFARATDYHLPLTLCLIQADPVRTTQDNEGMQTRQQILLHVLRRVKEQLREYDIVGRWDADTIVVGLVAYTSQEAQFWTEGLRKDIASSPIEIAGKRKTATVSVGIAQANPRDSWNSLIDHARQALEISAKQLNKVTVFS